ncbi:Flp pilus assembly complex ATPase component TadA [Candidatus Woesearchaeota archaeon]|nr:Flp pilus assembly complex ATPase component TadA [Candidatus Woesearchaeota archaeon]
MVLFKKKVKPGEHEVVKEGAEEVIHINYESYPRLPSIEDDAIVMASVIEKLSQSPSVNRVVFHQKKKYEYGYSQTQMLIEVAQIYNHFIKQKNILTQAALEVFGSLPDTSLRIKNLQNIILNLLRTDPIGAFVESKRLLREEKINLSKNPTEEYKAAVQPYLSVLTEIYSLLAGTKIIAIAKDSIDGYGGGRTEYKKIFHPTIIPDFMYTRLAATPPLDGELLDSYFVSKNTHIQLFNTKETIKPLYHVNPPEFQISEDKYELLELARKVLAEHQPKAEEFIDPEKMRDTFFNIGRDLITELSQHKKIDLKFNEIEELANILVRYTVGFGLIESLLQDDNVQDIAINSPAGSTPIFIVHGKYDECITNIVPSIEDAESWASKFRLISARPLDEANPVLDTELTIPGARARVAIISRPLNPTGLAFSIRRHRDKPWTLPLFIKNGMIDDLAAGLLSFIIDGNRSILVAGTRGSGKTSVLGSVLVEIMRKYRVITIEDVRELPVDVLIDLGYNLQAMKVRSALLKSGSELGADEGIRTSLRMGDSSLIVGEIRSSIKGNEKVLIIDNGETKRIEIKNLEGKDISNIYIPSMDFDLKFKLKRIIGFIKHPKRKKLLEVTTKTGRKITVTPDHSLFTHKNFKIIPIECHNLKEGSKIIIPEKLPSNYNNINSINLFEMLEDENCRVEGYEEDLRQIIKKIGYKKASEISSCTQDIYQYLRSGIQHSNISISDFKKLSQEANQNFNTKTLQIRRGTSEKLPANIHITKDFCRFLGYYVAEGYTQESGSVVFSNGDEVIIKDIIKSSENLFGITPYVRQTRSLGISTQITLNNKILGLMIKKLGCGRIAIEKRVPPIVFGLSEDKICEFLKGYFDGDGSQTSKLSSGNRIACSTISKGLADDLMYLLLNLGIVARTYEKKERSSIGKHNNYIIEFKQRKYVELFIKKIGFKKYKKTLINRGASHSKQNNVDYNIEILEKNVKLKRKFRHLRRHNSCGKEYLKKVVEESENASELIKTFVNGQFFLDEVKSIKEIELENGEYVYDLSVEPCQNFIGGFGGIMLHNTEAFALFEAMRVGALANTVAGTIHGDSPYGVFDRIVNDLQVPRTSFKAIDLIIVANPVRSADGLHRYRRVTQITEVRKDWETDPLAEGGFVDLMKYDSKTDTLVPTEELINGDSEIIKSIASNIKEWAGNWGAVWENILLRSKMKRTILDYAKKYNIPDLLEAKSIIQLNDEFHRASDIVSQEQGKLDNEKIFFYWEESLKKYIKLNYKIQ